MSQEFLSLDQLPFCRGCGHHLVARSLDEALRRVPGLTPLDVIVVTDIGCIGIIDRQFKAHTVHGLHGRSTALATGIALGLANPRKKVLVMLGDGGATIGLHHLLEAARRNVDLTVIVHNNMLYGMTGGQPSGLTPAGFRTPITPEGQPLAGYDICQLMHAVGAPYVRRVLAAGDFAEPLAEALAQRGFALIEAIELCPSYSVRFNPGRRLADLAADAGLAVQCWRTPDRPPCEVPPRTGLPSLFDGLPVIEARYSASLGDRLAVVLAGSAGEGVQSAAETLARAAMACGLSVTKKGSYPVTVGTGFSVAEIILSPRPIVFTGIVEPDVVIVSSAEGLAKVRGTIGAMRGGAVFLDVSLDGPPTGAAVFRHDYRRLAGGRHAALLSLLHFVKQRGVLPVPAVVEALSAGRAPRQLDLEALLAAAGPSDATEATSHEPAAARGVTSH